MTHRKRALGPMLALFLAACATEPATETAEPVPVDPATIRAQVDEFVSAWNDGDVSGLGSMIAEDAVLLQPDGAPLVGREAILGAISQNYDARVLQQSATVDEVVSIGKLAYARGTWTLEPTTEEGLDVSAVNGKWSAIYQPRSDGGWNTWRWMWNQPSGQTGGADPE